MMGENVSPILAPNPAVMLDHLTALFGRAMGGRIELTAIKAVDGKSPIKSSFFGVDELDAAVGWAMGVNVDPQWNLYVGAALRHDGTFPGGPADDTDFLKSYAVWADADSEAQVAQAQAAYRAAGLSPSIVVITGRTPERRAQFWWTLETPISDIDVLRATVRGIADALGTDHGVLTGKQLMRLAGSLAWPKPNKPGRALELTEMARPANSAHELELDAIHRAFPPHSRPAVGGDIADVEIAPTGSLGIIEKVTDGREGYAFRLIRATLRELIGTTGAEPSADDLYQAAAPTYFRKVDLVRPGRGPEFLKGKCQEAIKAYHAGQIPGMGSLDEAVIGWAQHQREGGGRAHDEPAEEGPGADAPKDADPDEPFPATDLTGEPPERRWIVPEWIPEGVVSSLYGDGGLGKTLLAQQLACAAAIGGSWLGLPVAKCRIMAVLCEDERDELHRRQNAIKATMGHPMGNPFGDLFLWPRLGRDNTLIRFNRDAVPTLTDFAARLTLYIDRLEPDLLILDTLADFYGGNEIDRVQVNHFVKAVLGGLIEGRKRAGRPLSVLLLGHPSVAGKAAGGGGYSGSTAWNAAVRSRMYLGRPEDGASDERILTRGKANYAKSGDETAVRLFYADGVLHASDDAQDGDSILWACRRDVVSLVVRAWHANEPYSGQKGHRRHIYSALTAELGKAGFSPQISRQAIRESIDDGNIRIANSNGKRGYKGTQNDG